MRGWLAFLIGFATTLYLAVACGATYENVAKVETNWMGLVREVDGGKTTKTPLGTDTLGSILDTLWSFAWLIGLCLLLLLVAAWRIPSLRNVLTAKGLRNKLNPKAP